MATETTRSSLGQVTELAKLFCYGSLPSRLAWDGLFHQQFRPPTSGAVYLASAKGEDLAV